MIGLLWALLVLISLSFIPFLFEWDIIDNTKKRYLIYKANKDKTLPKPLENLMVGDEVYIFQLKDLEYDLKHLNAKNLGKDLFKKKFFSGFGIHEVDNISENCHKDNITIYMRNSYSFGGYGRWFTLGTKGNEKTFVIKESDCRIDIN